MKKTKYNKIAEDKTQLYQFVEDVIDNEKSDEKDIDELDKRLNTLEPKVEDLVEEIEKATEDSLSETIVKRDASGNAEFNNIIGNTLKLNGDVGESPVILSNEKLVKLLNILSTIPEVDGTYSLKCIVNDGVLLFNWEA